MKRYTTRELAHRLERPLSQALALLKAASIPRTRCGSSYLWDAGAVDRLVMAIEAREGSGAQQERAQ